MMPALPLAAALILAAPALAEDGVVTAPSGQVVTLTDVLVEENPWSGEVQVVVRLVAPAIAGPDAVSTAIRADMDWACETWGLPAAAELTSPPDWIVVEMMEGPAQRGEPTPGLRRLFETYRPDGAICIWELF